MKEKSGSFIKLTQLDELSDSVQFRPKDCIAVLGISLPTFWRIVKAGRLQTKKLTPRTTTVSVGALKAFINGQVESE